MKDTLLHNTDLASSGAVHEVRPEIDGIAVINQMSKQLMQHTELQAVVAVLLKLWSAAPRAPRIPGHATNLLHTRGCHERHKHS